MMPTELSIFRRSAACAFAVVVSLVAGAATANAVPIVSHIGSADPTTEGWSTVGGGVNVSTGPVINDLGLGIDAWSVDDPTTAADSVLFYQFNTSPGVVGAALSGGWTLSTRIRVVNDDEDADRATFAEFIDGTTRWRMDFGAAGGDPIVLLQTGVVNGNDVGHEILLSGGGSGYHLYELVYDPVAMTADLFIDGTELFSDFAGMPTSLTRVAFGAGQAARTGHGHYNLVQFDAALTVSEPATLATFGFSLAALGWMGRRRKAA